MQRWTDDRVDLLLRQVFGESDDFPSKLSRPAASLARRWAYVAVTAASLAMLLPLLCFTLGEGKSGHRLAKWSSRATPLVESIDLAVADSSDASSDESPSDSDETAEAPTAEGSEESAAT